MISIADGYQLARRSRRTYLKSAFEECVSPAAKKSSVGIRDTRHKIAKRPVYSKYNPNVKFLLLFQPWVQNVHRATCKRDHFGTNILPFQTADSCTSSPLQWHRDKIIKRFVKLPTQRTRSYETARYHGADEDEAALKWPRFEPANHPRVSAALRRVLDFPYWG